MKETLTSNRVSDGKVIVGSGILRAIGAPITGSLGLLNAALVISNTGAIDFGLVVLVATVGQLFPFADMGLGAVLTTAVSQSRSNDDRERRAQETFRAAMRLLSLVPVIGTALLALIAATGSWSALLGRVIDISDGWMISLSLCLFCLTVPFGLFLRVITGLGGNRITVTLLMLAPFVTLGCTGLLALLGVHGVAYCLSAIIGSLAINLISAPIAIRQSKSHGISLFGPSPRKGLKEALSLLSGSQWVLVISVCFPLGIYGGRIVIAHLGTTNDLSEYGLGMQFYGVAWSILAAISTALWPAFVGRRSSLVNSLTLWKRSVFVLTLLGVTALAGFVSFGPWLSSFISDGSIIVDTATMFWFGVLFFVQCVHQPAAAMLTTPAELRWQAYWAFAMATISLTLVVLLTPQLGSAAVPLSASIAVVAAQIVPEFIAGRRMLQQRGLPSAFRLPSDLALNPAKDR